MIQNIIQNRKMQAENWDNFSSKMAFNPFLLSLQQIKLIVFEIVFFFSVWKLQEILRHMTVIKKQALLSFKYIFVSYFILFSII